MVLLRTFLLLAILCPQAASKQFLSKAVVDDDDLTQVAFGDCKEAANEESLIQGTPTGIPARCKCRPFGKGCPKFRLWIDNVEVPMAAMHKTRNGGKRIKGMKGKWKAGRGPPTKKRKNARLAKKSSGLAKESSALVKGASEIANQEDNQVPVVKSNDDDDEEWVWTPKGVSAITKEGVQKQMGTPAAGDDVSVAAKNFMNKHGTAGSAIENGMIKTAHQTEKAVKLFSANDEDEEGENIQNPFLSADAEEESGAAVEEDGSDDQDAEESTDDEAEVESFLQVDSEDSQFSAADKDTHEVANKLLAQALQDVPSGIPARCKCKPFGKGCPKFRLWIDNREVPMAAMHKTNRGGKRIKGMKGKWKAGRGPPTKKRKNARLTKKSSGLAEESSALLKDDKEENQEDNQVPVVKSNDDDDEEWVWTPKGVSAITKEGVQKQMGTPAAGDDVSVAAKNFMNKHGTAGSAIEYGMIKTVHQTEKAVQLFSANDEDEEGENIQNPFLSVDEEEESGADDGAEADVDTEGADETDLADDDADVD